MIVDVNVSLSRWPFRRMPCDETSRLVAKLKSAGVTRAWTASYDALLHRDLAAVNQRLADDCRMQGEGLLIPFGTVNPTLPDWQEDLRRCAEDHQMPGLRLFPNYHGYTVQDEPFDELLTLAEARGLIVQIPVIMEDERTQHPLLTVPPVATEGLEEILQRHPKLSLVLLNSQRALRPNRLTALAAAGQVYFDIAMQEGVAGVENLLKAVPADRVLFGSAFPFFALESARLKMQESELAEVQRTAIFSGNAEGIRREE